MNKISHKKNAGFTHTPNLASQDLPAVRSTMPSLVSGFTLLELLVVIAIIGFLASVVMVVLTEAKHRAWNTRAISQNAEFGRAALLFQEENGGYYPSSFYGTGTGDLFCLGTGCKYDSKIINSRIAINNNREQNNLLASPPPFSTYITDKANTAVTTYTISGKEYSGTVYLCTEGDGSNNDYCTKGYIIYPLYGEDCPSNAYWGAYGTDSILCFQDIVTAINSSAPKKGQGVGPNSNPNPTNITNPVGGGGNNNCIAEGWGGDETDTDCDGFPNDRDNCPTTSNVDQLDQDNDSVGDACDNESLTCEGFVVSDCGSYNGDQSNCEWGDGANSFRDLYCQYNNDEQSPNYTMCTTRHEWCGNYAIEDCEKIPGCDLVNASGN